MGKNKDLPLIIFTSVGMLVLSVFVFIVAVNRSALESSLEGCEPTDLYSINPYSFGSRNVVRRVWSCPLAEDRDR